MDPYSAEVDFSDSHSDDHKHGYTQLDYFLHWFSVPHFTAEQGAIIQIELTPFTRGYINAPQYTIANIDQGITAKIDKNILTITPDQGFGGIAYIDFKVTDAEDSSMTRTLGIKVGTKATGIHSMHLQPVKKQLNFYPISAERRVGTECSD